jgi:transcriptional regulator with XRE-family HTH domain
MKPERLADFAALLTRERKLFGTRTAFAKAIGITRSTLRALESGTQRPDDPTIEKIAAALHMPIEALTGEAPIKADDPLIKELETIDLEHANRFRTAPAASKHAAKDFLGPKISNATRERIAEVILVLLQRDDILQFVERYVASTQEAERLAAAPPPAPPRPMPAPAAKKRRS